MCLAYMQLFKFRVKKNWYAYLFLKEALEAQQYFIDRGYPLVSEVEPSGEEDFEFKLNPISEIGHFDISNV